MKAHSTDNKPELITLNGFTLAQAKTMIADFNKLAWQSQKPMPTSIWFSRDMISNIVDLLNSEDGGDSFPVDGIRIYYGRNTQGKNTVLLVSTYKNGTNPKNKTIHQDYFEHDSNARLFTDAAAGKYHIHGEICNDTSCGGGARLYDLSTNETEDENCDRKDNHFISIQYAKAMVWNFGTAAINTACEWFDLRMFENVLKCGGEKLNGLRIYFGKRPGIDRLYPDMDGFVIVTTQDKNGIPRLDYFDCDRALFHKRIPYNGEDNGEQCHPNCDGATLTA